jgi:hypothetical protein
MTRGDVVNIRRAVSVILNVLIVLFAGIGTYLMFSGTNEGAALAVSGLANFKYFTVLSNEFCGIVSLLWLIFELSGKSFPVLPKLMAASAVGLTFLIIAAFLAPMYPDINMYERGNFWFHLILPLTGMAELILLETPKKIPFGYTVISASAALVYGAFYLANILINGAEGNDWYGFLNWGFAAGIVIFAVIVLMDFGIAVLMRGLNILFEKLTAGRRKTENE